MWGSRRAEPPVALVVGRSFGAVVLRWDGVEEPGKSEGIGRLADGELDRAVAGERAGDGGLLDREHRVEPVAGLLVVVALHIAQAERPRTEVDLRREAVELVGATVRRVPLLGRPGSRRSTACPVRHRPARPSSRSRRRTRCPRTGPGRAARCRTGCHSTTRRCDTRSAPPRTGSPPRLRGPSRDRFPWAGARQRETRRLPRPRSPPGSPGAACSPRPDRPDPAGLDARTPRSSRPTGGLGSCLGTSRPGVALPGGGRSGGPPKRYPDECARRQTHGERERQLARTFHGTLPRVDTTPGNVRGAPYAFGGRPEQEAPSD